ncbi:MAG: VOC family protein [Chloroflexi bacterium]|nr:VOC family protein [Chloroflexota bacterium]
MLKSFAYHAVTVSNLDRAVAFYRDLLDMRLERTYELAGAALAEATGMPGAHIKTAVMGSTDIRGDHFIKLAEYLSPRRKQRFEPRLCDVGASHVTIEAYEIKELYEKLVAKGVRFISPPVHPIPEQPQKTFAYFFDPDGILLEIHRIPQAHHTSHVVSDLEKGIAFYRDTLGMKLDVIFDLKGKAIEEGAGIPGVNIRSAHMVLDSEEYVELHEYIQPVGRKQTDLRLCDVGCSYIAFEVDDVGQSYEEFRAKGARFISPPKVLDAARGVTSVFLRDPDSYVIELRSGAVSAESRSLRSI